MIQVKRIYLIRINIVSAEIVLNYHNLLQLHYTNNTVVSYRYHLHISLSCPYLYMTDISSWSFLLTYKSGSIPPFIAL